MAIPAIDPESRDATVPVYSPGFYEYVSAVRESLGESHVSAKFAKIIATVGKWQTHMGKASPSWMSKFNVAAQWTFPGKVVMQTAKTMTHWQDYEDVRHQTSPEETAILKQFMKSVRTTIELASDLFTLGVLFNPTNTAYLLAASALSITYNVVDLSKSGISEDALQGKVDSILQKIDAEDLSVSESKIKREHSRLQMIKVVKLVCTIAKAALGIVAAFYIGMFSATTLIVLSTVEFSFGVLKVAYEETMTHKLFEYHASRQIA